MAAVCWVVCRIEVPDEEAGREQSRCHKSSEGTGGEGVSKDPNRQQRWGAPSMGF